MKKVLLGCLILLSIFFLSGCSFYDIYHIPEFMTSQVPLDFLNNFKVISIYATSDKYGIVHIEGKIKNISDKTFSYISITFYIYDRKKNRLGTVIASIDNLAPNEIWYIKEPVLYDGARYFLIGKVIYY
jgi:hypothetical protein